MREYEVKAIKSASVVMFTVEQVFSYPMLVTLCRVFCSVRENQSISMRRTCKTLKQLHKGSLFMPSLDLSISVKSGSSPPAGHALA